MRSKIFKVAVPELVHCSYVSTRPSPCGIAAFCRQKQNPLIAQPKVKPCVITGGKSLVRWFLGAAVFPTGAA